MTVLRPFLHLLQPNECRHADIILLEKVDTLLTGIDGVDDDMIKRSTRRRNRHVILLVNGAKVALTKQQRIMKAQTPNMNMSSRLQRDLEFYF